MKTWASINLNQMVRVRLTDAGVRILHQQRNMLNQEIVKCGGKPLNAPLYVVTDGWAQFQLWSLMARFGPYMYNGNPEPPFEMEIQVQVEA